MVTNLTCSVCGSNQLTCQLGRTPALCQACGHQEDSTPAEHLPVDKGDRFSGYSELSLKEWRQQFYAAYERGDLLAAKQLLDQSSYHSAESADPCRVYKLMKREKLIDTLIKYFVWGILGLVAWRVLLYINRR